MAPNSDIIRYSPTPAFTARMLALPALNEAVNRAIDAFDSTKSRNDAMGAALRAAEASMRVAALGALPLATPIVNTVGGWSVVDEWACRGLDRVEKVAPIIKKPTNEIVTTTRHRMLKALAGGTGGVPESLPGAITARANQTAEFVTSTRGGMAVINVAEQILSSAHVLVDSYLPPLMGDHQGAGVPAGGVTIKMSSLLNKTQQRLQRSVYVVIRPPQDKSLDGRITIALLISFGRRSAEDLYREILREPQGSEPQNLGLAFARFTIKFTRQYNDQLQALLQRQLEASRAMDREAIVQFLLTVFKNSRDMTFNAGVYVQGGVNAIIKTISNALKNSGTYWLYFEETLRKAMTDYEEKDRVARATAAAESWRKKNQMERVVVSPTAPEVVRPEPAKTKATGTKSKGPTWQKKLMGKQ